jgi:hypothetical protein
MEPTATAALSALYLAHRRAKDFGYRRTFEAADLGISANTLGALVRRGLATQVENKSSLRGGERLAYRITQDGRAVVLSR